MGMKLSKVDLFLLSTNLVALGGLLVLITLRVPSWPSVLLAIGAAGAAAAKLGKAFSSTPA